MQLINAISELRQRLASEPSVVFVPTMGNLHEGHLALVEAAKYYGSCVVVSIFVNRLQFEPGGDFDRYPRTLHQDCEKLQAAGASVIFVPDEEEIYPVPQQVLIQPPPVAETLEGEYRPGHFAGMATVVLKLLNIVQPRAAIFGKKDYQQLAIVREMAKQLNLPIEIVGEETVRAPDGLALSSRNGYLSSAERAEAPRLNWHLQAIRTAIQSGQRDYAVMESVAMGALQLRGWKVDYISVREQRNLAKPNEESAKLVILGAAWLGNTRLIDNIEVDASV